MENPERARLTAPTPMPRATKAIDRRPRGCYNAIVIAFEDRMRQGGAEAIAEVGRFFMKQGPVHETLTAIAKRLDELGVPYAVVGGMALVAHGYQRTTIDVDLLVSQSSLDTIHAALDGRGYLPPFMGSRNLRDTQTCVRIEFVVAGQYPGDGKPKPVVFPDPKSVGRVIDGVRYVTLPVLIELKLASGMSSPGRLRDLADVQELIRTLRLTRDYAATLNPFVAEKFNELCDSLSDDHAGDNRDESGD